MEERRTRLRDDELMHYGTKGMKKGQHDPNKRWQSHAVYAQGKPNPNAKVRGKKEGNESKAGTVHKPIYGDPGADLKKAAKYVKGRGADLKNSVKRANERRADAREKARAEAKADARAEANRKHLPGYQSKIERKAERDARIAKADSKLKARYDETQKRLHALGKTERSAAKERARTQKAFNEAKLQKQNLKALKRQAERPNARFETQKAFNEAKKKFNLQKQNLKALKRQMELSNARVDQATKAYNTAFDRIASARTASMLTRIFA